MFFSFKDYHTLRVRMQELFENINKMYKEYYQDFEPLHHQKDFQ